jgi:hypothetical protein
MVTITAVAELQSGVGSKMPRAQGRWRATDVEAAESEAFKYKIIYRLSRGAHHIIFATVPLIASYANGSPMNC